MTARQRAQAAISPRVPMAKMPIAVRDAGPWPRGLRRPDAARYVGVGLTKFDELVADGRMPKPKTVDGCVIWDRVRLDDAFESLPDQGDKLDRSRWRASQ